MGGWTGPGGKMWKESILLGGVGPELGVAHFSYRHSQRIWGQRSSIQWTMTTLVSRWPMISRAAEPLKGCIAMVNDS